jgi:Ca-activated chloride channel family protein
MLLLALPVALSNLFSVPLQTQSSSDDQSLRLRADLVLVDVLPVQKKTGRIIGDLKREDFSIVEDGVQQKVEYFSKDKLPVSIVLLVDRVQPADSRSSDKSDRPSETGR